MPETTSIFERHPRTAGILIFATLFILLDLIVGAIFIPRDFQNFRVRHPHYHHGIEANRETITNWGNIYYRFSSNSLGFRDSMVQEVDIAPGATSLLLMGDSHTEAVGVDYSESFGGILSRELQEDGVVVLNGAAVSYSPKLYYLKCKFLVEEKGLRPDHVMVFIDMSDLNNEIGYQSFEPSGSTRGRGFFSKLAHRMSRHSSIVYLADRWLTNRRTRFFNRHMAVSENAELELYADFFSEFENEELLSDPNFHQVSKWLYDEEFRNLASQSINIGKKNMRRLKELCERNDIGLTISVHPWPDQVLKGDTTNLFVESWRDFASNNNVGFINLYPVFINETNAVITANQCYIQGDNHWNATGHRKVGEALVDHFENRFAR